MLAVANYSGGNFVLLPVLNGRLLPARANFAGSGTGPNKARQNGPHAHAVVFAPGNRFLIGADLGIDRLLVQRFDGSSGAAETPAPAAVAVTPGAGPRHFAFHPDGRLAWSINELDSTITAYAYDAERGTLKDVQSISTLPGYYDGPNTTAEIAVHEAEDGVLRRRVLVVLEALE